MKIYYAHSLNLYGTPQEKRDVETLERLGFEVLNPNTPETQKAYDQSVKDAGGEKTMTYFEYLVDQCGAIAYRPFIDLKIGSGVWYEVNYGLGKGLPIFELPTITKDRILDLEETRNYLHLVGQR